MDCLVREYLSDWLIIRQASVRPRTHEQYAYAVGQICEVIGDRRLADLTAAACASVLAPVVEQGHERTAQILHNVMRMAFDDAAALGMLSFSPMAAVKRPRHRVKKVEPFTHEEISALISADSAHAYLWVLLWKTGIRRGEACALRWSDVDFKNKTVSVERQAVRTRRGLVVTEPKSDSGLRTIPIDDACADLLRGQLRKQLAAGRRGDYVISPRGDLLEPRRVNTLLQAAADAVSIPHAHPHRFRHTFGTDGVSAGVPIRVLQALMGHSEITVTAKYYAAVRPDAISAAHRQLARYWGDECASVF